ncbi:MAG: S1C family serine protease [Geminicoccaceae bacterium]
MTIISANVQALTAMILCRLRHVKGGLTIVILSWLCASVPLEADEQRPDRLAAIVQVNAIIPHDARTAQGLGTKRTGTGVVIDDEGLVLTVGYVILEAIEVSVKGPDGTMSPANIIAYDHESGFGLIRTHVPIDVAPISLGDADSVSLMEPLLVASKVGRLEATGVYMVDRRPFAGYWEYLLEDAMFTAPPHTQFGGAALINRQGQLVGIGSLILNDGNPHAQRRGAANMFIPVDELKPILDDLLDSGRRKDPAHPWLGLFFEEHRGRIFVSRVAPDGPAQAAGMAIGDLILGIDGEISGSLADFYRALWQQGDAGVDISLDVVRNDRMFPTVITSGDRYRYLRLDPTF